MTKQQRYTNVSDVLRDVSPDGDFRAEFDKHVADRKLIKQLLALRAVRGLSQQDIAGAIGCTQSRISKLENAKDDEVRLGDLKSYADAIGCELSAWPVRRDMKPTEKVKCHTFAIKQHMDDLAQLAKSDEDIAEGVASFFHDLFVNFMLMLGDSTKRLPRRSDDSPYFDVRVHCACISDAIPPHDACNETDPERAMEATP